MEKPNIIMILLDGLRADRFNLCPYLSKTLKQGYFFSNMVTAAPYTAASLHSVFSGLYPTKHGVDSYFNMFKFRKELCKTMPQYLSENGYFTMANLPVDSIIPQQGFDKITLHDKEKEDLIQIHKDIIAELSNKRFFLFIRYEGVHAQIIKNVSKKYTDFDEEYFKNYELNKRNYNSYLIKMDDYLKELIKHLNQLGLLKNTIVIIFSDHGMSNGEKIGEKMYGSFTYDYTIKVFCSFLIPGTNGKKIDLQTRTIDIMPTVLDLLGIKADHSYEHLQGISLIPMANGKEKKDRIAFAETGGLNGPWPSHNEHNVFCVRLKKWKLIYNKTPDTWEMYDLGKDPEEKNNVIGKHKELESELKKMLLNHIKTTSKSII